MSKMPPNPGTNEAINAGCTCPVLDNCYGEGYMGFSDTFIYTEGCPVHIPISPSESGVPEEENKKK